jgi:hypothetical protein
MTHAGSAHIPAEYIRTLANQEANSLHKVNSRGFKHAPTELIFFNSHL